MIKRCKIHVGYDFLVLIAFLYVLDSENLLLVSLLAAFLHELGHITAMVFLKVPIAEFRLSAFGACITAENPSAISYCKEFFIALSGPLVGFLVSVISAKCHAFVFSGVNFSLSIVNMIPVPPLDGGRALRSVIGCLLPISIIDTVFRCIGVCVALVLVIVSLVFSATAQCRLTLMLFSAFFLYRVFMNID